MQTLSFDNLDSFAQDVAKALVDHGAFCLWLSGDLGAGKTTITGRILYALGLPRHIPVTSPTFTYFNEYQIGKQWYGHLDLYRAGDDFILEELGVGDLHSFRGFFVEWPEQVPKSPILTPTHELKIELTENAHERRISFRCVQT